MKPVSKKSICKYWKFAKKVLDPILFFIRKTNENWTCIKKIFRRILFLIKKFQKYIHEKVRLQEKKILHIRLVTY